RRAGRSRPFSVAASGRTLRERTRSGRAGRPGRRRAAQPSAAVERLVRRADGGARHRTAGPRRRRGGAVHRPRRKRARVCRGRRTVAAAEARDYGLVARVVAKEAWLDEAKRVAHEIAAKSPVAVHLAKDAVDQAFESPLQAGIAFERRAFYLARAAEDASEGL